VLATKILGHTGDIARFRTTGHYASYTGTAPIEASSGDVKRHRLSRAGNRKLNNALHLAARVQAMHPAGPDATTTTAIAEGKTTTEAVRSLIGGLTDNRDRCLRAACAHRHIQEGLIRHCVAPSLEGRDTWVTAPLSTGTHRHAQYPPRSVPQSHSTFCH
jgi:hypothetical protein